MRLLALVRVTIRPALFVSLPLLPGRRRVQMFYDVLFPSNLTTESTLYMNFGYWKDRPATLDAACEALVDHVAQTAGLGPTHDVLDVGFGFCDQDIYWVRKYRPRSIVGVNITPSQVHLARRRIEAYELGDTVRLEVGNATALRFADSVFDKVLAVECAFHFDSRQDFLSEAYRVLRPGGCIVATEILPLSSSLRTSGIASLVADYRRATFAAIPRVNWYAVEEYTKRLREIGFATVEVSSIRDDVYAPLLAYTASRLNDGDVRSRMHPLYRLIWERKLRDSMFRLRVERDLDYVIVDFRSSR